MPGRRGPALPLASHDKVSCCFSARCLKCGMCCAGVMGKSFSIFSALILYSTSLCLAAVTEAKIVVVNGSVSSKPSFTAKPVPVSKGDIVTVGSTVQTEMKSDLLMSPLPGTAIRVLENNSVVLTETDLEKKGETVLGRKAKLQLNRGTVQVGLDKIGGTADFKITTPQCVAAARGTIFATTASETATTVIVLEGVVSVPWKDGKGKAHAPDVRAKMKVTIKKGRNGLLEQEGPVRATRAELSALEDFFNFAATWRLLSFPQRFAAGSPTGVAVGGGRFPLPLAPEAPLVSP